MLNHRDEVGSDREKSEDNEQQLNPDEIAKIYLEFHRHHKSTWSWEIELRPKNERF